MSRGWVTSWKKPYEVGYGSPPKSTRFNAGESGNPKGRPRKRKGNRTALLQALDAVCVVTEGGVTKRMTHQQLVHKVLVKNALKGNAAATSMLFRLMQHYGLMNDFDDETNKMVIEFVEPKARDSQ